jgi:endonuclease YncB( thermonuclease family)
MSHQTETRSDTSSAPRHSRSAGRRAVAGVAAAVTLGVVVAAPLAAAPQSVVWTSKLAYGTTDHTLDGDTVAVRVDGDSSSVAPPHVRNAGIQAMETGECHAAAATASMDALTRGKRLRLTTADATTASQGRPVRYIDAQSGSTWVDVQLAQLQGGHALPLAGMGDISRWKAYATAGQEAAIRRVNLFDTDYCKSGPAQSTPLKFWINYDGNGNEAYNANTEYVRVLNSSATNLAVGGWRIRTAAQDTYTLPANAVVPAKGLLTLRVGKGTNTPTKLYWGASGPKFSNVDLTRNIYGGGAYLFDRDGDLRTWSMYPCLTSCSDSRAGHVAIWVRADAPGVESSNVNGEYIRFAPSGVSSVDLSWTVASTNGFTYEFPRGTVVHAGETLTLRSGKGTSTRLNQYWGNAGAILVNAGQHAELRTPTTIRLGCRAWGTGRC